MCSQLPPISATCYKKFLTINILQHHVGDFPAEPTPQSFTTIWALTLITTQKNLSDYTLSNFYGVDSWQK